MPDKHSEYQKVGKEQHTNERLENQSFAEKPETSNDRQQLAIRSLLRTAPVSVDEKLATVKAAQYVDKDRFQNAFRMLMATSKT